MKTRPLIITTSYGFFMERCRVLKKYPHQCIWVDDFKKIKGIDLAGTEIHIESDFRSISRIDEILAEIQLHRQRKKNELMADDT